MGRNKDFSYKLLITIAIIILILITAILAYEFIPRCGDGKITEGEDCYSCPKDVRCSKFQTCHNKKCVTFCGNNNCDPDETQCSCPQDCGVCSGTLEKCRESFCEGTVCSSRIKENCCGNNICEPIESSANCPDDCISKLTIESIGMRISEDEEITFAEYNEGDTYIFDEYDAGNSNVASISMILLNEGNIPIENIIFNYECLDSTYERHSLEICYRIPEKMDESLCSFEFHSSDRSKSIIVDIDKPNNQILLMPVNTKARLNFYISPVRNLDHFWKERYPDKYHNISCRLTFSSVENALKKEVEVENYLIRSE